MPGKSLARQRVEAELAEVGTGQQSAYHAGFETRAFDACMLGATNDELAARFGVDVSSIELWIREKPRFRKAVHKGREGADEAVAKSLHRRALGMTLKKERAYLVNGKPKVVVLKEEIAPDTQAALGWLANRQRGKWRAAVSGGVVENGFDLNGFAAALGAGIAKGLAPPGESAKPIDPLSVVVDQPAARLDEDATDNKL